MSGSVVKMKALLAEATKAVAGDRNHDYGDPVDNHRRTAELWSTFLGVEITPRQVCICNILQKVSREAHFRKRDTLVDIAGYAANAEACSEGVT